MKKPTRYKLPPLRLAYNLGIDEAEKNNAVTVCEAENTPYQTGSHLAFFFIKGYNAMVEYNLDKRKNTHD